MSERTVKVTLSAQVQGYIAGMEEATRSTRETASESEKLTQQRAAFQQLGGAMVVVGGAITAVGLAAVKTGVDYNSMQQSSRAALLTMLGSAEAVNEQMDKLDAFAKGSPFSKATFIQAQQQMLAFGIETQKVIPYLDAIQNAVAASGGSNDDIAGISATLSKIQSSAKITAQDLNELGGRGVNAAELIGSQMGKTGAQIREEITSGSLDATAALDALTAGMSEKFAGAADNVKDTFAGAMDRVKAAWRDFSSELAKPLVDPEGGGALVDFLNGLADAMRNFEKLPEPVRLATTAVVGLTGAALLAGGTLLLAVPKIVEFKIAMAALGITGGGVAGKLKGLVSFLGGPWGIALMAAAATVAVFNAAMEDSKVSSEEMSIALRQGKGGLDAMRQSASDNEVGLTKAFVNVGQHVDALPALFDKASTSGRGFWSSLSFNEQGMLDNVKAFGDELSSIASDDLPEAQREFRRFTEEAKLNKAQMAVALDEMKPFKSALLDVALATGQATDDATLLNIALGDTGDATRDGSDGIDKVAEAANTAAGDLDSMKAALDGIAGSALSMGEAQDAALSAINNLTAAADDENASLYGADDASIKLRDSMRDVETSHRDSATAILENKGSMEEAMGAWQAGRDKVVEMRMAMGESREEAVAWADKNMGSAADVSLAMSGVATAVKNIPAGRNIDISVSGNAVAKIQEINNWLASTPDTKHISISGTGGISGLANGGIFDNKVKAFANSGFEPGIYPYTPGGIHKFAEEHGESYISMDPARRPRSMGVWQETGDRLGAWAGIERAVAAAVGNAGGGGAGVSIGSVQFRSGSERQQFREFENTLERLARE